MKSYKDVCGVDSCVWFEISPKEGKKFLKWAKELGCVWVNGEIIELECYTISRVDKYPKM